jgi:hypothetical protein
MGYIIEIIFYISFISAGLAMLYGLGLLRLKTINLLVLLVAISFLADVINAVSSYYYTELKIDLGIRHVGDIYRIIELIILSQFFNSFLFNKKVKTFLNVTAVLIVVYFIIFETNFFQNYADSTLVRISSALLVISFSLLFFKSVITKMEVPNIAQWPLFYFISALFIYFSGVLIAFFLYEPMMRIDIGAGNYLWTFHNAWLIVRNMLLIIGFYYTYKTNYKWSPISIP